MLPGVLRLSFRSLGLVFGFEFVKMSEQFFFARKATEVVAQHLKGSLRWLAAGPQVHQQASDDCAVALPGLQLGHRPSISIPKL